MSFIDIWGWVCGVVGVSSALPQVIRLLAARTSAGLSLLAWQLNCGALLAWTTHGIVAGRQNLIWPNLSLALLSGLIVVLIVRDRKIHLVEAVWPVAALFVAMSLTEVFLGPLWFGIAALFPGVGALGAQLKDLIERPDLRGVSLGTLIITALVQALWLSWGLMAGDEAIRVVASIVGAVALANLVVYLLRHAGLMQARVLRAR